MKARKQWMYGFEIFKRAREMGWTSGRCQGFKHMVGGAREKCRAAGGDVMLKQYCTPGKRKAGQNTVLRMFLLAESLACICRVQELGCKTSWKGIKSQLRQTTFRSKKWQVEEDPHCAMQDSKSSVVGLGRWFLSSGEVRHPWDLLNSL